MGPGMGKVADELRFFCEGCRADLPSVDQGSGRVTFNRRWCDAVHPALLPPRFPIVVLRRRAAAEPWREIGRLSDPVRLGILTSEQAEAMRTVIIRGCLGGEDPGPGAVRYG